MPPQFCSLLLSSIATYHTLTIGMSLMAVVGLGLTIVAAFMKGPLVPSAPAYPVMLPPPLPPIGAASCACPKCGRANQWTDRFCSSCGTQFL
jgi:hypothetical protein